MNRLFNMRKDKRIKIEKSEHEYIKRLYEVEKMSKCAIARHYNVDKRLIDFILDPEVQKRNVMLRKKRGGWKRYYDKEKHRQEMHAYRYRVRNANVPNYEL